MVEKITLDGLLKFMEIFKHMLLEIGLRSDKSFQFSLSMLESNS